MSHSNTLKLLAHTMKGTTPSREIIFNVYCGKTLMSPDGLISSVGTSSKTCGQFEEEEGSQDIGFYHWLECFVTCIFQLKHEG